MNKQIKELAEQAGAYFGEAHTDYFGEEHSAFVSICDMDIEKFAELIVRECIEICRRQQYYDADDEHKRGVNGGSITCMNAIKREFGVE